MPQFMLMGGVRVLFPFTTPHDSGQRLICVNVRKWLEAIFAKFSVSIEPKSFRFLAEASENLHARHSYKTRNSDTKQKLIQSLTADVKPRGDVVPCSEQACRDAWRRKSCFREESGRNRRRKGKSGFGREGARRERESGI